MASTELNRLAARARRTSAMTAAMRRLVEDHAAVPDANEIRMAREWLGWSQADLALALGFSPVRGPQTVRELEDGFKSGSEFKMTPTVAALLRARVAAAIADDLVLGGQLAVARLVLNQSLPAQLRSEL